MILAIIFLIFLVVRTSYSHLRSSHSGENLYVMKVGLLEVTFVDSETSTLTLSDTKHMTDLEGFSETNMNNTFTARIVVETFQTT